VERTLGTVLAGECADDFLRELVVLSVTSAPNAARLLVTVALPVSVNVSIEQVVDHLGRAVGKLRSEVAAAVRRRKVPELAFHVVTGNSPLP
jgi:ribosome-binding factor A